MIEILTPNFIFEDERGLLVQLVREGFRQVNVISSIKGAVRGGHFHKLNHEAFYIISGEVELIVNRGAQRETHNFKDGDMFQIPPYIVHEFIFNTDALLVSMYDLGAELPDGGMDIYKQEVCVCI